MKKVLIISSTPRVNGNSEILCEEFLRGAKESGNIVELIKLRQKKIGYCIGCQVCYSNGTCFQKDDMNEILNKMVNADVIVLATPVYFYSMCAQLKTLIDRSVARYTELNNKEFYYILTCTDTNKKHLSRVLEGLRGFTLDCLDNAKEKGIIYGIGASVKGIVNVTDAFKDAYEMGKKV